MVIKKQCTALRAIHRLDLSIRKELERQNDAGDMDIVTRENGHIIRYLSIHDTEDIYQKNIEAEFGINRSTVSRILGLMEQKGLIIRTGVEGDARLKKIELTEKSRSITARMFQNGARVDELLFTGFSAEEITRFEEFIERMQKNLTKE